eukprot:GCRY01000499.1.p1 GENE.GCRY01000499.1~~GCRY01000499.1.p1  ORF type:complete len:198 (+),score=25.93 GCRY01000499.1:163-756(+)
MSDIVKLKIITVGDGAVGKTSLLITFCRDDFPTDYIPTVFENYIADMMVDQQALELSLWDTAGQEDYDRVRPLSYPDTDVFLLCFSLDKPESFVNVSKKWTPEIRHLCPEVPIILVGTKSDLKDDPDILKGIQARGLQPLKRDQIETMRAEIGAVKYIECSAKTRNNIMTVFEEAAKEALKKVQTHRAKKTKKCIII